MPRTPKKIAELMAAYAVNPQEQFRQTTYRCHLVDAWKLKPGQRILEIGCGQGDTTAILADRVGPTGSVVAIDTGKEDYGAPITLGEATAHLEQGPLGSAIEFHLGFRDWTTLPKDFDIAVMAHCAWYFASVEELTQTLRQVRERANKLMLAEWSLAPMFPEQIPHYLAASIQSLVSGFQPETTRNVRLALSDAELLRVIESAGWRVENQAYIHRPVVADGQWEVQMALDLANEDLSALPPPVQHFITTFIDTIRSYPEPYATLPSLVVWAS